MRDIAILAELPSFKSLRALARAKNMAPPHVSRILQSLEAKLNAKIFLRSSFGIHLTQEGRHLSALCESIVRELKKLTEPILATATPFERHITVGSRGFMNATFCTDALKFISERFSHFGLQLVDLSPIETMEAARNDGIDIAVTMNQLDLGKKWQQKLVGQMVWSLYGRKNHPLTLSHDISDVGRFKIIQSIHWDGRRMVRSGDLLPLAQNRKCAGHEVQTAAVAVKIVSQSDQLAYVPRTVALPFIEINEVVEIPVAQTHKTYIPVYVAAHMDRVQQKFFEGFAQTIGAHFDSR